MRQESDPTYLQRIKKAVISDRDTMTQVGMGGVGGGLGGGGVGARAEGEIKQGRKARQSTLLSMHQKPTGDGITSWHWGGAELGGGGEGGGEAGGGGRGLGGGGGGGVEMRRAGKSTLPSAHQKRSLC